MSAAKEFAVAAGSNMVSGAMFNCFDVARVRLQIQDGLGQPGYYRGLPQTLATLLHLTATAFEDAHPRLGRGPVEEGQVNTETVVGVILRAGVGHQLGEALPAGVGQRERCEP